MRLRALLVLASAAVAWLFVAPAANAVGAYPPTTCSLLSVSTTTPLSGETITVSGENFQANASVRLELRTTVYVLGTVQTDAQGSFSTQVTLPDGVTGTHRIVAATGFVTGGTCGKPSVTIDIHGTSGSSASNGGHHGGTAFTGLDILALLAAAAALIGIGVAVNRGGKRRRASV